ncbi:MAG TPA: thermonuclease family protein [Acidobacteriota bacterium]|nr:thermonuclease family protein [Acidobacteriota bacterium]
MSSKRTSKRKRLLTISVVLVLALLIVAFRLVEEIGRERRPSDRFVVARVLDGDTVELRGGDRLRLLAIDTPEKGDPLFDEATRLLDSLAVGETAVIRFAEQRRDRYGRLLGYLYVDTLFVNRVILERGLGYLYLFGDSRLDSPAIRQLLEAQRRAMEERSGLWGIDYAPEDRYIARQGSFRLHRPGCRSVQELAPGTYRVFATREEGLAIGLSPCRNCKP